MTFINDIPTNVRGAKAWRHRMKGLYFSRELYSSSPHFIQGSVEISSHHKGLFCSLNIPCNQSPTVLCTVQFFIFLSNIPGHKVFYIFNILDVYNLVTNVNSMKAVLFCLGLIHSASNRIVPKVLRVCWLNDWCFQP